MKVLIFGANGQVGDQLVNLLNVTEDVEVEAVGRTDFDLQNVAEIRAFVLYAKPDWVINAAAYTAVDQAETDVEQCFRLNAQAPEKMALACSELGAGFVHYSTDYVFDGVSSEPYREGDATNPMSVYGRSKLLGEELVLKHLPAAIVFRTAWVYAQTGKNFVNTMLRLAKQLPNIKVVCDQYGSPTYAADLARVSAEIILGITKNTLSHQGGVFHATGSGQTNWYEFCCQILAEAGVEGVEVTAIDGDEYPTPAPRPNYSVLSNKKLFEVYEQRLPHWRDSLRACLSAKD